MSISLLPTIYPHLDQRSLEGEHYVLILSQSLQLAPNRIYAEYIKYLHTFAHANWGDAKHND